MSKRNRKEVEAIVSGMGVFMAIISSLVELVKKFGGTMENIYRLATPEGIKTLEAVARLIVDDVAEIKNEFLKLISAGHSLILDACDGSEIIAGSSDMFEAGVDSDFVKWSANELGAPTLEMPVEVHEMVKNRTFTQVFGSLSSDINKLCFTQAQINGFVRKYKSWLRTDGYGTFFLFKSHGHFFVADVCVDSDGRLGVHVLRFEEGFVWNAEGRRHLVVPQQLA